MRLSDRQIHRIADLLLTALVDRGGASLKGERAKAIARIESIFRESLSVEDDLDKEARKLLEAHLRQAPPGVDRHTLLQMIKKRLAEKKGVPL